jgi:predicted nucleic acid-binding protein
VTRAFDSNVLVYSVEAGPKGDVARALLAGGGSLTVQNLNEFTNVAIRKLGFGWDAVAEAIASFIDLCGVPAAVDFAMHVAARELARRYQLSFYDALIVAAALASEAETLFSEDMQDGLVIADRLTIRNPFA